MGKVEGGGKVARWRNGGEHYLQDTRHVNVSHLLPIRLSLVQPLEDGPGVEAAPLLLGLLAGQQVAEALRQPGDVGEALGGPGGGPGGLGPSSPPTPNMGAADQVTSVLPLLGGAELVDGGLVLDEPGGARAGVPRVHLEHLVVEAGGAEVDPGVGVSGGGAGAGVGGGGDGPGATVPAHRVRAVVPTNLCKVSGQISGQWR